MRSRVTDVRDAIRTQLWPAPTVGIVLAVLAGVLLPELDRAVDDLLPDSVTGYLFGGGASAARSVLDAVASSLITVTSLTFSLTVVTLQLASGQFSPRLLRTFTRDRFVHVTLALFLATFVYALTVLRTVRTPDEQQSQFVPQISVTVAFVLAVASVVALVLFLAHLAREIRVETMLDGVHRDASSTVERLLPDPSTPAKGQGQGQTKPSPPVVEVPPDAEFILAAQSGFLTAVDDRALCRVAAEAEGVVMVDRACGVFLVAGTPLGRYWWNGTAPDPQQRRKFEDILRSALTISKERNDTQDFTFGLRQLTDVTTKALSPGVNDPTTAIHSLGHTSALLCEIASRTLEDRRRHDDAGRLRVICPQPDFAQLLDDAITQPRRYGAADPAVMIRLSQLLREVAWSVRTPDQRAAVSDQLLRLRATVERQDFDDTERSQLELCHQNVRDALDRTWTTSSGRG